MSFNDNINQSLPSDCFYVIFARLPTRDLIRTVPLVCRHWAHLQPESCRQVRSLHLTEEEWFSTMRIFPLVMRITRLWPTAAKKLVAQFPRIKQLDLFSREQDHPNYMFNGAYHLLDRWSPYLRTLKLTCSYRTQKGTIEFDRVINLLNTQCVALKQLDFYFGILHFDSTTQRPFDLPLVARLEKLSFSTIPSSYPPLLRALGAHRTVPLKHLKTRWISDSKHFLRALPNWHPNEAIYKGARMLQNLSIDLTSENIRLISHHLPHLRVLTLFFSCPVWGYSHFLSQFKELHTLKLRICEIQESAREEYCTKIYPLNSVRHLKLYSVPRISQHTWINDLLRPVELLPAIETVHYKLAPFYEPFSSTKTYKCKTCHVTNCFESENHWLTPPPLWEKTEQESLCSGAVCLLAALTPFDACNSLNQRIVSYPTNDIAEYLEQVLIEKGLLPEWQLVGRY